MNVIHLVKVHMANCSQMKLFIDISNLPSN